MSIARSTLSARLASSTRRRAARAVVHIAGTGTVMMARRYRGGPGPCLVLAPHADDESFGCGGTIAARRSASVRVVVVVATDGALSDRHGRAPDAIASARRAEAIAACGALGVGSDDVRFLDLPDGELAERHDHLVERLQEMVDDVQPQEVFVCSRLDPHPDHVALHRAATEADLRGATIYEYLVWAWPSWPMSAVRLVRVEVGPRGSSIRPLLQLMGRLRRSHVAASRGAKARAIALYDSQAGDGRPGRGVPPQMVERYRGRFELLIERRPTAGIAAPAP